MVRLHEQEKSQAEHCVVVVGAGFAGFNAARGLSGLVGATTEIVVINSTDYFLYLPLMPQVAGGLVEPRHVCASLPRRLPKVRFVLGTVGHVDPRRKRVSWAGPDGSSGEIGYDRVVLTAGSVNKLLPIPGIADYAHGFRSIAEAMFLRDEITRQLELAAVAADPAERAARCTFVVVGAGYTGTEVAAQGQLLTTRLAKTMPGLAGQQIRWMLLDTAPRLLPELDPRLSKTADQVLRRRGVQVRTGQSVTKAMPGYVILSTGEKVPTSCLIWCVGVRPDPLVDGLDLKTDWGRLVVDEFMSVPDTAKPYKHHDEGFLVDLGGTAAAANPMNIPLSGPAANAVTRGYHLSAMSGNRMRVLSDWTLNAVTPPEATSFDVVSAQSVPLDPNKPRA
jgi:NADH:ubiquinone reductase (H+-translocating)